MRPSSGRHESAHSVLLIRTRTISSLTTKSSGLLRNHGYGSMFSRATQYLQTEGMQGITPELTGTYNFFATARPKMHTPTTRLPPVCHTFSPGLWAGPRNPQFACDAADAA